MNENGKRLLLQKELQPVHCEFLEYWNTQKSVWRIWQRFSCLLDEGIPKIWKKFNSHDGFLSYLQNSTANSAHLAAHFCACLSLPSKSHHQNSISSIFLESPDLVDMKNVVKCWKDFLSYFTTLETYRVDVFTNSIMNKITNIRRVSFFSSLLIP